MSEIVVFELTGFKLAEIWFRARNLGIGLNTALCCEFKKQIAKKTKSKSIIPKITGMNRYIAETIVKADLGEYYVEMDILGKPKEKGIFFSKRELGLR
jgi:hypothetical protein